MKKVGYPLDMNIHISKENGERKIRFNRIKSFGKNKNKNEGKAWFEFMHSFAWGFRAWSRIAAPIILFLYAIYSLTSNFWCCVVVAMFIMASMVSIVPTMSILAFMAHMGEPTFTEIFINVEMLLCMLRGGHWKVNRLILHGNEEKYSVPLKYYFWVNYEAIGDWVDYKKIMVTSKRILQRKFWKFKFYKRLWYFKIVFAGPAERTGYLKLEFA